MRYKDTQLDQQFYKQQCPLVLDPFAVLTLTFPVSGCTVEVPASREFITKVIYQLANVSSLQLRLMTTVSLSPTPIFPSTENASHEQIVFYTSLCQQMIITLTHVVYQWIERLAFWSLMFQRFLLSRRFMFSHDVNHQTFSFH